jgi:antitoxin HigA-1
MTRARAVTNPHGSLSPEMAIRLEKAFGVKMDTLLRMQTAWEIAEARKRADEVRVVRFVTA